MLSQEHDVDATTATTDRDDATGLVVPEPRSPSAARLLEMTARETDQWRADAKAEAAQIVAEARQEAETLLRTAQREAEGMREAARTDSARTVAEANTTADGVRVESEKQRSFAEAEVARLQKVADDHAQHLRQHLNEVLARLDK